MLHTLGTLALEGMRLKRPKPLLLLAYLALEGLTPRRRLAELFFSETKDPNDSLSTALKHLRDHLPDALVVSLSTVETRIVWDVPLVFEALGRGEVSEAAELYQGAFLTSLDLDMGEELEDWVYTQQDRIAQRYRLGLLAALDIHNLGDQAVLYVEHVWRVTQSQEWDANTLGQLYERLRAGGSPLTHEVRRQAAEYGIPLLRRGFPVRGEPEQQALDEPVIPTYVLDLAQRLEALRESGEGLALGVWGAPGIGKTWTIGQLEKGLTYPIYTFMASASQAQLPRSLPRAAHLPSWTRTVLASLQEGEALEGQAIVDAVAAVLAAHAPIVLHVGDFHEASDRAQELWGLLAEVVMRTPGVALLATSRQVPPPPFISEALPPLSHTEVTLILEWITGAPLPAEATDWINDRVLGNPLFALEFYRYFRKQGDLWHDGTAWRWRVPATAQLPGTIETLISQAIRSAELSETARRLLQVKALLPTETPDSVLAQVAELGNDETRGALRLLKQQGILGDRDFLHPLYREVQYAALGRRTRQKLARRIIAVLSESDPERAAPFVSDADLTAEYARDILLRAAESAQTRGLRSASGEHLMVAAQYAAGTERQQLLLRAAEVFEDIQPARSQHLAERILDADPTHVGATLLLARSLVVQGAGERADSVMQRLPEGVRPEKTWLEHLIGLRTERNDYTGAVELWQGAGSLRQALTAHAKRDVAFSLVHLGQLGEATALLEEATAVPGIEPEALAALLEVQATIAFYTGAYPEALALLSRSLTALGDTSRERRTVNRRFHALRFRSMCFWGLGENRQAIRDTEAAMELAAELGSGRDHAIAQTYLGVPLTELGEFVYAEAMLLESREVLRRADAREHLAACEAMLSHLYIEWQPDGAARKALGHAYASVDIARDMQAPIILSQATFYASWTESTFGDAAKALRLAEESLQLANEISQLRNVASGLWARAVALEKLDRPDEALTDYERAAQLFVELNFPTYTALVGLNIDRLRDDSVSARKRLEYLSNRGVRSMMLPARKHFAELFGAFPNLHLDP